MTHCCTFLPSASPWTHEIVWRIER
jgi:hypothetical protein